LAAAGGEGEGNLDIFQSIIDPKEDDPGREMV
jgi:hypothetical protein